MLNFQKQVMAPDGEYYSTQRIVVFTLIGIIVAFASLVLPWVDYLMLEMPGIIPVYVTGSIISYSAVGIFLFVQFYQSRTWPLALVGSAYLFNALIAVPYLFAFPGGVLIENTIMLGNMQTAGWIWSFWHLGFPILILVAIIWEIKWPNYTVAHDRSLIVIGWSVTCVMIAVLCMIIFATFWQHLLPRNLTVQGWSPIHYYFGGAGAVISVITLFIIWHWRLDRGVLYLWLPVVLVSFFLDITLSLMAGQRYTLGWYAGRICGLISACTMLIMFLIEINRLYVMVGQLNIKLEQRVAARTTQLQAANSELKTALTEKNVLLREVYHRVKNNLQVVDTLLNLQMMRQPGLEIGLEDLRRRVNALGLVHQQLMQSEDLATFASTTFFADLTDRLKASFIDDFGNIEFIVESDQEPLDLDFAIPLGLLVTELMSNSVKHAFPHKRQGWIKVNFHRLNREEVCVMVEDNGVGMPEIMPDNTIGQTIIESLVMQLDGTLRISSDGGTRIFITLPRLET